MKIILITGASRGIGGATAILAAKAGYAVAVNYRRNRTAAEQVVSEITGKGGTAVAIQADITREEEVMKLFSETDRVFGRLDVLVNNAGILEPQMRLEEMDAARLSRIFAANITGQILCAREAVKRMSLKHGGSGGAIVNVSSIAAKTGAPGEYIDYAASKGAIDTFTVGLAKEVAEEGIRVNAVRPAFIYTDIHADGGEPGRIERIKASIPLRRGGLAGEVAEAILWLASEKSSYSTGIFINVSGGR
ncbi:NAD(P)-dependent dehydrogenase (short-subunit alcohol dehydrogenase family) [Anseongella ginsenosidimutans]|uniref:NAD(P)-dependent dehydrogenase (Short-subunit alcohol dehydrogenase family) n=1 Tax=Anseongella ginsenosidimutans TaxID=496056 RepID=A0A4R3KR51_9SPHI|nr:SDR family oxidoreductase [Anseongella ginsenosidimutans]QEC53004.1 SDR family oxidoreductase [Anseongella ginsenosidimutans]TCS87412.1 NAD(P)-dependent dehydrogenase (short-subunit alcohol dehydrogenase family) [Anseongella ginsenosidimutans]